MRGAKSADERPVIVEEGWVVCLGETRLVREDRVWCPLRARLVEFDGCLACHFAEALDEERAAERGCAVEGPVSRRGRPAR
jgi:hypothetical protein